MDALAGYGSDSSSSSSSSSSSNNKSDSGAAVAAPTPAVVPARDAVVPPPAKKKGRWDNNSPQKNGDSTRGSQTALPKPHLSSNKSMIEWEVDYLSSYKPAAEQQRQKDKEGLTEEARIFLQESLLKQQQKHDTMMTMTMAAPTQALGKQLKQQHNFHNPRFFENTASSCGIIDMLGTNLGGGGGEEIFEEYEYNLLQLEEEARTKVYTQLQQEHERNQQFERQQQQQQQQQQQDATTNTSQFATNQLERALQQQCNR